MESKKTSNQFPCELCHLTFPVKYKLEKHIQRHTNERPHKCPSSTCGKEFPDKSSLASHVLVHSGLKGFECNLCNKRFLRRGTLRSHMRVHSEEKKYLCELCGRQFRHVNSYKDHLSRHAGNANGFNCQFCHWSFPTKGHLESHIRSHTTERHYQCPTCPKSFRYKCNLTEHEKVHLGIKQFKCETCGKRFLYKGYFQKHLKIHSGEKDEKYHCKICDKQFLHNTSYRVHLSRHAVEGNDFVCEICSYRYRTKVGLRRHQKDEHGLEDIGRNECVFCKMRTQGGTPAMEKHLRSHIKEAPYFCKLCDDEFRCKSNLKSHEMRIHKFNGK